MILFNAAWVGAYWERLLVPPLVQRRVAGQEPPSERRSEGQPVFSEELRPRLHHHRAPISATQPTDLLLTDIRATRDTPLTPVLRDMDIRATPDIPLTPVLRAMDTKATRHSQLTPPRVTDRQTTRDTLPTPDPRPLRRQAARDSPLTPVVRAMDIRARRPILRTPVPVSEIRSLTIPAIALRRIGRLGPSTRSSLLAEFWPDTKSSRRCAGGWTVAE